MAILSVHNLHFSYQKGKPILQDLQMRVPENSIYGFLGSNGAGKSTTLKAISGLLKHEDGEVTDGSIEFMGERIDRLGPEKIAKMGIARRINRDELLRPDGRGEDDHDDEAVISKEPTDDEVSVAT